MRRTTILALSALLAAAQARAQAPDWTKIEIKAQPVAGNVYMLYGVGGFAGGNIGVSVGADGIVLVDDQFAPLAPKIEKALAEVSGGKAVRFVLNTHWHGDHTHGNTVFGKTATIVAHDNVRKRVAASDDFDGQPGTKAPPQALPLVTFDHEASVHLNGEDIRALHQPAGHTDGDSVVVFTASRVVHMGDLFFNGLFPFIDLDSGGSVKGYLAGVELMLERITPDMKVIPGHGPLASRDDLAGWLAMLKETTAVVEKGLAEGKTADQLKAAKVLSKWERFSWEFINTDRYIDQLARGLKPGARTP